MTTTVEHHDDHPPGAGVPREVPAEVRARRSMLALAAVESGRLLRHPAVLAATALSVWLLWRWGRSTAPVLNYADIAGQLPLALLGGAALLAANLAMLRPHRDGAVDLYGATRLSLARRTLAHLLSVLPLAALGGILVAADLTWVAGMPGRVGTPHPAEAATGPALIVLGGCLGVLLGLALAAFAAASRDPAHRRLPSQLRGVGHGFGRSREARRKPAAQESLDPADRVERSVG
jgi:hypothetical protein